MVSAFKKQKDKTISLDHRQFNRALAKPRVRSEHCIGIWKGRFPWLRKICKIITNKTESLRDILRHIECCVVLHNMLLEYGDVSPDEYKEEEQTDIDDPDRAPEQDSMNEPIPEGAPRDARRTRLLDVVRENHVPS